MIQKLFFSKTTTSALSWRLRGRRATQPRLRRGQALIEMALVVVVLLLLTLGLIQYGLLANAKITMDNIAREGARYAALHGVDVDSDDGTGVCPGADPSSYAGHSIRCHIKYAVANTTLKDLNPDTDVTISPNLNDPKRTPGKLITVTVTYNMRKKFILPSGFPGLSRFGTATAADASMVIEGPQ